jgi:Rod binding domain-containing protein
MDAIDKSMLSFNPITSQGKYLPLAQTAAVQAKSLQPNQAETAKAAKQVEEAFLNELLKTMFQNTELAKGDVTGDYLPFITEELSKSIASQKGIGIQEFLMKSPTFNILIGKGNKGSSGDIEKSQLDSLKLSAQDAVYKAYGAGMK